MSSDGDGVGRSDDMLVGDDGVSSSTVTSTNCRALLSSKTLSKCFLAES